MLLYRHGQLLNDVRSQVVWSGEWSALAIASQTFWNLEVVMKLVGLMLWCSASLSGFFSIIICAVLKTFQSNGSIQQVYLFDNCFTSQLPWKCRWSFVCARSFRWFNVIVNFLGNFYRRDEFSLFQVNIKVLHGRQQHRIRIGRQVAYVFSCYLIWY